MLSLTCQFLMEHKWLLTFVRKPVIVVSELAALIRRVRRATLAMLTTVHSSDSSSKKHLPLRFGALFLISLLLSRVTGVVLLCAHLAVRVVVAGNFCATPRSSRPKPVDKVVRW